MIFQCFLCISFIQQLLDLFMRNAKTLNPNDYSAFQEMAQSFISNCRIAEGRQYFQYLRKELSNRSGVYQALGILSDGSNLAQQAQLLWKQSIEQDPKNTFSLLNLANMYLESENLDLAQWLSERSIKADASFSFGYYCLGTIYEKRLSQKGSKEKAIQYYQNAIKYKPDNYYFYQSLGRIYENCQNYKQALKCYKRAIKNQAISHRIYYHFTLLSLQKGEEVDKIKQYLNKDSIQQEVKRSGNQMSSAILCIKNKQLEKAEGMLFQSIKQDPQNNYSYILLGDLYGQKGLTQISLWNYKRAVQINRKSGEGYYKLGMAQWKADQLEQAKVNIKKSIKLQISNRQYLENYAWLVFQSRSIQQQEKTCESYNQALKIIEQAINKHHESKYFKGILRKADIQLSQQDFELAKQTYSRVLNLNLESKQIKTNNNHILSVVQNSENKIPPKYLCEVYQKIGKITRIKYKQLSEENSAQKYFVRAEQWLRMSCQIYDKQINDGKNFSLFYEYGKLLQIKKQKKSKIQKQAKDSIKNKNNIEQPNREERQSENPEINSERIHNLEWLLNETRFNEVVRNEKSSGAYLIYGMLYPTEQQWKISNNYFEQAIKISEQNYFALFQLIKKKRRENSEQKIGYQQKIDLYKKVLNMNNKFSEAYSMIGHCHKNLGNYNEADYFFRKAARFDFPSYKHLGYVHLQKQERDKQKYQKSQRYLELALKSNSRDLETIFNLGCVYQRKGKIQEALKLFQKAVELNQNHPILKLKLIGFKFEMSKMFGNNDLEELLEIFQKYALSKDSEVVELKEKFNLNNQNIEWIKSRYREYEEIAKAYRKRFLNNNPNYDRLLKDMTSQCIGKYIDKNPNYQKTIKQIFNRIQKLEKVTQSGIYEQFQAVKRSNKQDWPYYQSLVTNMCVSVRSYRAIKNGQLMPGDQIVKSNFLPAINWIKRSAEVVQHIPIISKFGSIIGAFCKLSLSLELQQVAERICQAFSKMYTDHEVSRSVMQLVVNLEKNKQSFRKKKKNDEQKKNWLIIRLASIASTKVDELKKKIFQKGFCEDSNEGDEVLKNEEIKQNHQQLAISHIIEILLIIVKNPTARHIEREKETEADESEKRNPLILAMNIWLGIAEGKNNEQKEDTQDALKQPEKQDKQVLVPSTKIKPKQKQQKQKSEEKDIPRKQCKCLLM